MICFIELKLCEYLSFLCSIHTFISYSEGLYGCLEHILLFLFTLLIITIIYLLLFIYYIMTIYIHCYYCRH